MKPQSVLVYIPTRGRVGWNKQVTLREFLSHSSHKPILVCPPEEVNLHRAYYPRVRGCSREGIGPTRQWILESSSADIVVMADDDLYLYRRPDPTSVYLTRCKSLDPMVEMVRECVLRGYPHGGVSNNQHNRGRDLSAPRRGTLDGGHVYMDNYRVNNLLYCHRDGVLRHGARFDELMVMEDFHLTLSLLTRGVPNRVIYTYSWNHKGSNREGGCSLYRTPELQAEGARSLHRRFPEFVKVTTKACQEHTPFWGGMKERVDVTVQWERAYTAFQEKS